VKELSITQFIRTIKNFGKKILGKLWQYSHYRLLKKIDSASLTDLEHLSYDMPFLITHELHYSNDFYGQAKTLKKFVGLPESYPLKCVVEHGASWVDAYWDRDINNNFPCIISMSSERKKIFEKVSNKKCFSIGPYLAYADNFLSDEQLKKERERLGKTLLFFPMHSIKGFTIKYDFNKIVSRIKAVSQGYDTVRVCLYWKDIELGYHKIYQNSGFECVSAGHIYSGKFLSKLKSIIELSDTTMSFGYGTTLGYCIYMNKPHHLMKVSWKFDVPETAREAYDEENYKINEMIEYIYNIFGNFRETISLEQREFVDKYWGLSCIKTKNELAEIFNECENLYAKKNLN
jgi:hypothetical protein